jgi:hypothetical protein
MIIKCYQYHHFAYSLIKLIVSDELMPFYFQLYYFLLYLMFFSENLIAFNNAD